MGRNKRVSKAKKINPTFFVFCEGKTEESYVYYLKAKYRLSIEIDAKISENRITEKYISNYKNSHTVFPKDKTYLIYDLDVKVLFNRIKTIKNVVIIGSNPCFELWYLLHFQEQKTFINSSECINKLIKCCFGYKKGYIDKHMENFLEKNQKDAIDRAKKLKSWENPSSNMFEFIEDLDQCLEDKKNNK